MEISIGKLLKKLRKEQGLTVLDVSRGLCAMQSLSRFEADERFPDKFLADRIFGRIGKVPQTYEMIVAQEDFEKILIWEEIGKLIRQRELQQAVILLNSYVLPKKSGRLHAQLILKTRADILRLQDFRQEAMKLYKEALAISDISDLESLQNIKCIDFLEMEMIYQIAEIKGSLETEMDRKEALELFRYLEAYIVKYRLEETKADDIYIAVLKHEAEYYIQIGWYDTALEHIERGIKLEKKNRKLKTLSDLLWLKCELLEKTGRGTKSQILESYKQIMAYLLLDQDYFHEENSSRLELLQRKLKEEYQWDFTE